MTINLGSGVQDMENQIETCGICDEAKPLVRDHSHSTGLIRGMVCVQCNCWLGVYERNKERDKQCGRRHYKAWAKQFEPKIEQHLQTTTGEQYESSKTFFRDACDLIASLRIVDS